MNYRKFSRFFGAALALAAVAGCSSGGNDGGPVIVPPPPGGGIEGSGIAIGIITGFGSVIVNDVRYESASAMVTVDGQPATESDLDIGDVVVITGTVDASGTEGTAETILLDHIVEGPVSAIDAAAGTFVVLGQTVTVNDSTSFHDGIAPESIAGLSIGDFVEVSGFVASDNTIFATRIELDDDTELELTGAVMSLDTGASRFDINGQSIDYSNASLSDFPASGIADGDVVEVKGNSVSPAGELVATSVELKDDDFEIEDGDEVEVEGFITRFASATDFDVSGVSVTTNAQTEFENGMSADLAIDVKVEVEGEFGTSSVLVADKVQFRVVSNIRVSALVDSVGADSLVALGVTVNVDGLTRFEDESSMNVAMFSLADINVGDFVEVRGSAIAPGELLATQIERDDDPDRSKIRGFVDSVSQPSLVVFGVTVDTDGDTDYEDDDGDLTEAEFFARVQTGDLVEAKGDETGDSSILAEEVEFEDD